jgi:hypothetical protein
MAVRTPELLDFERPSGYRDELAARPDRVRFLRVAPRRYLVIDGSAIPGSKGFRDAFAALYPVAYTLHFALKRRAIDAPVGALEGLFWATPGTPLPVESFTTPTSASRPWSWRLMLPVPDQATDEDIVGAIADVKYKKAPHLIDDLRVEMWEEGPAAQVLHAGAYGEEAPTIVRLHAAIDSAGLRPHGCHHEIYISDPNRTSPDRLKTVIRQAVEAAN